MVFTPPHVDTTLFVFEIAVLFATMFNVSLVSGRTPHFRDDVLYAGVALAGWVAARVLYPPGRR